MITVSSMTLYHAIAMKQAMTTELTYGSLMFVPILLSSGAGAMMGYRANPEEVWDKDQGDQE